MVSSINIQSTKKLLKIFPLIMRAPTLSLLLFGGFLMVKGHSVLTLAGDGTSGYWDGVGTAAKFFGPRHIVLDGAGGLLVSDTSNQRKH